MKLVVVTVPECNDVRLIESGNTRSEELRTRNSKRQKAVIKVLVH